MSASLRQRLISTAKILLGVGILVLILSQQDGQSLLDALRRAMRQWPWLVAGASLFLVCLGSVVLRWALLLKAQGIRVPLRRVFCIAFIGHFFNSFMLGATGGDLVKAYYTARESGDRKAEGVATVFIDRIVGLVSLLLLTDILCLLHWPTFSSHPETRPAVLFMLVLTVALAGLFALAFSQDLFTRWRLLRWFMARWPKLGALTHRLYSAFYLYRREPVVLAKAVGFSLANHGLLVCMAAAFGHALGIDLSFWSYLAVVPLANMIGAIPVTPGGLGLREGAYYILLGVYGVPKGDAVVLSLLVYASMLLWSLVGGLIFLFFSSHEGRPHEEDMDALRDAAP